MSINQIVRASYPDREVLLEISPKDHDPNFEEEQPQPEKLEKSANPEDFEN